MAAYDWGNGLIHRHAGCRRTARPPRARQGPAHPLFPSASSRGRPGVPAARLQPGAQAPGHGRIVRRAAQPHL